MTPQTKREPDLFHPQEEDGDLTTKRKTLLFSAAKGLRGTQRETLKSAKGVDAL